MIKAIALDDEPLALEILQSLCDTIDYIELNKTFTKSDEAFKYLKKYPVDLLFLDINMPGKSGLECLEEIRNSEGVLKEVNIVMLSTSNDPENIQKALELGATCYAVKPSSFEKLKSLLKEVLSMDLVGIIKDRRKFLII